MSAAAQPSVMNNQYRYVTSLRSCPWSFVLGADLWLRKLGFYGSITATATRGASKSFKSSEEARIELNCLAFQIRRIERIELVWKVQIGIELTN